LDTTASYAYRFLGHSQDPPARPAFAAYIRNTASGYAFQDYWKGVPLAAYDMETVPPKRLAVAFQENNTADGSVDGRYWPPLLGTDNSAPSSAREWLLILRSPYTGVTPDSMLLRFATNPLAGRDSLPAMWLVLADRRNAAPWEAADEFEIFATHQAHVGDLYFFTTEHLTTADELNRSAPLQFFMEQNYPNPFNSGTTIRFALPERSRVSLVVYDILGQPVARLIDEEKSAGVHSVSFDPVNLPSGVYFYRVQAGGHAVTKRLALIR
jgi:hypothetical protein